MKILLRVFLAVAAISLLTGLASAQCEKGPETVVISSWKWSPSAYILSIYQPAGLQVKVKNNGDKTITSVTYAILILDGLRDDRPKDKLTFTTDDKPVKPKEERKFTKRFDYSTNNRDKASLVIMRVQFADGTSWQNPCDKT
jgi:hypothetical protein